MAYIPANLRLVSQGAAGAPGKIWNYLNADNDTAATIDTSGYISDARARGMTVGDFVFTYSANASVFTLNAVQAITAGGAADLADSPGLSTDTD